MKVDAGVAVAAAMLLLFAVLTGLAAGYPSSAGLVPLVIGVPALLLCAWQLWAEIARAQSGTLAGTQRAVVSGRLPVPLRDQPADVREELLLIGWVGAFAAAIVLGGFAIGGTAAVVAFMRIYLRERWTISAGAAALSYLMLDVAFGRLLGVVLFEGLLFGGR
jgi:hypothetical protein